MTVPLLNGSPDMNTFPLSKSVTVPVAVAGDTAAVKEMGWFGFAGFRDDANVIDVFTCALNPLATQRSSNVLMDRWIGCLA